MRAIKITQNKELKREKVTWEVTQCSRPKNDQAKNLNKKDLNVYKNFKLESNKKTTNLHF